MPGPTSKGELLHMDSPSFSVYQCILCTHCFIFILFVAFGVPGSWYSWFAAVTVLSEDSIFGILPHFLFTLQGSLKASCGYETHTSHMAKPALRGGKHCQKSCHRPKREFHTCKKWGVGGLDDGRGLSRHTCKKCGMGWVDDGRGLSRQQ